MSDFKQNKIRNREQRNLLSERAKHNIITALGIILFILVVYYSGLQLLEKLSGTRFLDFITSLIGKDLITDEQGRSNILFLGVGGEGHEGKDLTDTVLIASLNIKNADPNVSFFSLPRDLYVESSLGESRINRLYEKGKIKWDSEEGMDLVRKTAEDILAIKIPYVAKVDFEAFKKIIDEVGGIDIYVENTINDPFYPKDETFEYETFFLPQGNQHLDGETALKYVRSRKTTSDFDRSKRQQQVLIALKNKAQSENSFSRKRLLRQMYYSMQEHIETNISIRELLTLADFAMKWNSKNINTVTLNDEPILRGGFLYTPLRELYGGAFVFLPAGDNWDTIRKFVQLVFYGPKNYSSLPVAILNGTETSGLAAKAKSILYRFGLNFSSIGNARRADIPKTTWFASDTAARDFILFLQKIIPGDVSYEIPPEYTQKPELASAKIILELGKNALPGIEEADIFKNIVPLVPTSGTST